MLHVLSCSQPVSVVILRRSLWSIDFCCTFCESTLTFRARPHGIACVHYVDGCLWGLCESDLFSVAFCPFCRRGALRHVLPSLSLLMYVSPSPFWGSRAVSWRLRSTTYRARCLPFIQPPSGFHSQSIGFDATLCPIRRFPTAASEFTLALADGFLSPFWISPWTALGPTCGHRVPRSSMENLLVAKRLPCVRRRHLSAGHASLIPRVLCVLLGTRSNPALAAFRCIHLSSHASQCGMRFQFLFGFGTAERMRGDVPGTLLAE